MADVGNGKWRVSIQKTVPVIDDIPDQTYTGSEITPEPLVLAGSLNLTKGTDYVYSYTNNTDAGTAKVIVTFMGDYESLGSVEKEFTIVPSSHIHSFDYSVEGATITATCSKDSCPLTDNKATLTINAPTLATYGGTGSAEATLDGLDAFKAATGLNISGTDIKYVGRGSTSYGESSTAPTDAGTYTASIIAGGKTASVDYTIAPKSISITSATATERDYEKDNTSVEISAVTFDGATLTKGTDYTVTGAMEDDTASDSKSVTVTVTLTNGNYTFGTNGNTKTTTVKINKIDHDGVTSSGSAKYGREGTVDLSSLIEAGGSLGEVSVSDTNNVLDGTPTIETDGKNLKFKFANNSSKVGKTATVTIPVTGATNYNDYNIVVTLTVAEKIVPTLAVSDYTKTYDGNSVTISDLTKSAKAGSLNVDGTWTFEETEELKNVSDSGEITVKFTPIDTTNYESATTTFTLKINRKAVTVKADNKQMVVGTTPAPELTATVSGTVGSDKVIYSLDREAGTVVGDYVITPSGDTLQGNYTVSYETGTFTITEDTTAPVVKKAPKAITGLVYNGTAQALVEPGEAENGTMYYAVTTENTAPADNLYTTSNYTATNAGTYYVYYMVIGDDSHHDIDGGIIIVTIAPSSPVINTSPADVKVIRGSKATFRVKVTGEDLSFRWETSKDGENWKKSSAEGSDTNKLSFTATKNLNGRYYRCVVSNDEGEVTSEPALLTTVSNIAFQPKNSSGTIGSEVTFSVKARSSASTYQWQISTDGGESWKTSSAAGNTSSSIKVKVNSAKYNGYLFRCKVTNGSISEFTNAALLSVKAKITKQPENVKQYYGNLVKFYVKATGVDPKYQWLVKNASGKWVKSTAPGNDSNIITFTATSTTNGREFRCMITDGDRTIYSNIVSLTSVSNILTQPKAVSVKVGNAASFSIKATGTEGELFYNWQYSADGGKTWEYLKFSGYDTEKITISKTKAEQNGYLIRCRVKNRNVITYSNSVKLTVK